MQLGRLTYLFTIVFFCAALTFFSGCNMKGRGGRRPLLRHGRIKGEIKLVLETQNDRQKSGDTELENKTELFEERLKLKTTGDLYHPDLLSFSALVGFGLAQQDFDSDRTGSNRSSGSLEEYNIVSQILRSKPYPIRVYQTKTEEIIPRKFLSSLRSDNENAGMSLLFRSEEWPMSFQYNTSKLEQSSLGSELDDFLKRDEARFRYELEHKFSKLSHMRFNFERNNITQGGLGEVADTVEERYVFLHDLIFGDTEQHRLDSYFSYFDVTGTFLYKNTELKESLRLWHSPNFETFYEFGAVETEQREERAQDVRVQAGFIHRLYESLVTQGSFSVLNSEFDPSSKITLYNGLLSFSYTKRNPWGRLLSSYSVNYLRSEQSGSAGTGFVVGESHLSTTALVRLDRPNIDVLTIRVRDTKLGGLNYTLGEDYEIVELKGRVFLQILRSTVGSVPNFAIGDEDTEFFVDYTFLVEPEREENTLRQRFNIKEQFDNGLSLYYNHYRQDETISSNLAEVTPDEFRSNVFGANYYNKGLWLLAEYSKEDSTQISSDAKRLEASYNWSVRSGMTAGISASNVWLSFGSPDSRDLTILRLGAELSSRLTDRYNITGQINYREEDDSSFGITEGFDLTTELQYAYRQLKITTGVKLNMLKRRDDELENTFFYFRLKRFF